MRLFLNKCSYKGFSEIQRISKEYSLSSAGEISYKNMTREVHPIIYVLITNKYATYTDIKYNLTIEEVLDLYEMCMCNQYNKNTVLETIR